MALILTNAAVLMADATNRILSNCDVRIAGTPSQESGLREP